jgi:hypothetical protein
MEMQNLDNSPASDIWGIVKNLVIVIVVIVALLLISYFISRLLQKNFEFADNLDLGKKDIQGDLKFDSIQSTNTTAKLEMSPSVPPAVPVPVPTPVHDITGTCYVPVTTYEKYQKITNPASVSEPAGYIGRDQVCYRNKIGDFDFVKRRFGCMACQVDRDKNKKHNYDGTGTNVISTCVYADNADLEHGIWDEKMCKDQCEKLKDSM